MATNDINSIFKKYSVDHLNKHISDHRPIVATLSKHSEEVKRGKRRKDVKFEGGWVTFKECNEIVSHHWNNNLRTGIQNYNSKLK